MDVGSPRWGGIGVAFSIITAVTGFILALLSLSDAILRNIGIGVCIVSLVILFFIYRLFGLGRRLLYQIVSDARVVTINKEVQEDIQILFNGKQVNDARLVIVKLINRGNSIPSSDYESPFTLAFGTQTEILSATITDSNPKTLKDEADFFLETNKVVLEPLLLNKDDFLQFKFLIANKQDDFSVSVRINDLKEVESLNELKRNRIILLRKVVKVLRYLALIVIAVPVVLLMIIGVYMYVAPTSLSYLFISNFFPNIFFSSLLIAAVLVGVVSSIQEYIKTN